MTVYSVSQVNMYVKALLHEVPQIQNLYIAGEISNFKHYFQSGHMYFTLKDEKAQLKCVMFSFDNQKIKFEPQNGMQVICFGQIDVYERDGVYQLYVRDMQPKGVGALHVAYEQLRDKLEQEGLFDAAHKKPIPMFPKKIGVATSNVGAAIEDIKTVIGRRYPLCELIIAPTVVQGEAAPADIVRSLARLDALAPDIIIVGRGGGSLEDLWAFNTEEVARAVFRCHAPVISAVGHETDVTICDCVADLRAPTPSAAAEFATNPTLESEQQRMASLGAVLERAVALRLEKEEQWLAQLKTHSPLADSERMFHAAQTAHETRCLRLRKAYQQCIKQYETEWKRQASMLHALSPLAVLGRGYAIMKQNGSVVHHVDDVQPSVPVNIVLADGEVSAQVIEVKHNEETGRNDL